MGDDIQLTLNWVCFEMIGFLFVALAYGYSLTIMFILVEMKEKKHNIFLIPILLSIVTSFSN